MLTWRLHCECGIRNRYQLSLVRTPQYILDLDARVTVTDYVTNALKNQHISINRMMATVKTNRRYQVVVKVA